MMSVCVNNVQESLRNGMLIVIHDSGKGFQQSFLVSVCVALSMNPKLSINDAVKMFPQVRQLILAALTLLESRSSCKLFALHRLLRRCGEGEGKKT